MDAFFIFICDQAHHAHWIIFFLLLLSGFSLPISEDLLMLSAGAIASTCIPNHTLRFFIWVYAGCALSAWIAYWIGRLLGPKLYRIRLFSHILTPERLGLLRHYYAKFGIFTFMIGRFCPGGVRNALFMSSGLTKMPFPLFILRDGLACLLSTSIIFSIGYQFGENIDAVVFYFNRYTRFFIVALASCLVIGGLYYLYKNKQSPSD